MKKIFSLTLLVMVALMTAARDIVPEYDITGAGSGTEGTVLVKVFVYGKKVSDADLKRAAVHGIVFLGCSGNASGAQQPAIAPASAEKDNAEFFAAFFAIDGECQNYASIVSGSYETVKTKKGYKVGAIIQVNKSNLRKSLEKAGIIRSLNAGF